MDKHEIVVPMPNGDQLIAEWFNGMPYTIAIGLQNSDGMWIQDLAIIEPVGAENLEPENKYKILVYDDEFTEDWTNKFEVDRIPDDCL